MKRFLNYLLNKQWILNTVMYFLSEEKKETIQIFILRYELAFWGYDTPKKKVDFVKGEVYSFKNEKGEQQQGEFIEEKEGRIKLLKI